MLDVADLDLHDGAAWALRDVSLRALPGEVTCVMGRNGVGKTSLMRAIIGHQPISGRRTEWEGADIARLRASERRGEASRPRLLILDEPTEGIQPSIIKDIGRAIARLRDDGRMAILLVEQFFDFAWAPADRIVVLERGAVVMPGARSSFDPGEAARLVSVQEPQREADRRSRAGGTSCGPTAPTERPGRSGRPDSPETRGPSATGSAARGRSRRCSSSPGHSRAAPGVSPSSENDGRVIG